MMMPEVLVSVLAAALALVAAVLVWRQAAALERLRLLAEQGLAGQRTEAETLRAALAATERALATAQATEAAQLRREVTAAITESRAALDTALRGLREGNEARLGEIQKTVQERLDGAVAAQTAAFAQLRGEVTAAIAALQAAQAARLHEAAEAQANASGQLRTEVTAAITESRGALDTALRGLREGNEARLGEIQKTVQERLEGAVAAQTAAFTQLRGEVTAAIAALQAAQAARLHEAAEAQANASGQLRTEVTAAITESRAALDARLRELREGNEAKLAEIHKTVNEQLQEAVEKQMTASFTRVTEQFAQVQKAMGEMQAVGAQIGDLKRLFGNVKTRGGWGEGQVRAMLDDILPEGAYDTNWKPRAGSDEAVEFAVKMPARGETQPRLPIDAKFPVEDYERMLSAIEAGDAEAEKQARRGLERRVRLEAQKMQEKYIAPPATVEFAVMYVPTDGIYGEIARIDGLIDELGRVNRVLVLGPSLFPALLHTIHLGYMTLTLEQKAEEVGQLLSATKTEMQKMDKVLESLDNQAGTFSRTIAKARVRTRAVDRKLRSIAAADAETTTRLLGAEDEALDEEEG